MTKHDTYEMPKPTCPGCGYALDDDDMNSDFGDDDLWSLAPDEGVPRCNARSATTATGCVAAINLPTRHRSTRTTCDAQRTSSGATGMTRSGIEGVPLERRVRRLPAKVERKCPRCGRHAYHWLMAHGSPAALKNTQRDTAACANCGHHWPCRVMEKDL